ncbi:MAG: alkaline phosphatase family protein [Robiginitomaculum sp.]|nr:alkaline phosphatase family protein [Robiginitomaculum sp.]
MRLVIIVAGILLVGCNPAGTSSTKQIASSSNEGSIAEAPSSADVALRAFYAGQDIEFPKASPGPALPASDKVITRIAFGSCQASWKPIPILDQVVADDPDLFIYLGDNIYGDERAGNALMPNLRQQYADLAALPEFRRLREQTPMMAMWDDHDYGLNDGGGDFAFKHFAEKVFLEFWNEPKDSIRRKRDGLYDAKLFGVDGQRVQIIMLDTRFFRSSPLVPTDERGAKGKERYLPSNDPNMTILGDAQWKWFEQQLQEPADIRFIVTSIQVLAADHGWESWREFTPQREKFFTTVEQSGAKGVVIISGDRHVAAFYEKKNSADYSLYEFTSSPLNMSFTNSPDEYDTFQVVDAVGVNNYGLIDVDWQGRKLIMQIKDIDGGVQRELQVPFSKIGL